MLKTRKVLKLKDERAKKIYKSRYLYLMVAPAALILLFFSYAPMGGLIMAFQDFSIFRGFQNSEWVGLENFITIFSQAKFTGAIFNTVLVSVMILVFTFPAPIILALLINEVKNKFFKRFVQTASYLPHFLSTLSVVGLVQLLFNRDGLINDILVATGAQERIMFLAKQEYFVWFLVGTNLWKEVGWSTIIHLANLTSINPDLYEAAEIDGAGYFAKLRYITIPHMLPTVVILLIFQLGKLFSSNFDLVYGLQNPFIDFEVISTIIYRTGIKSGNYSVSTAFGLVEGLVALALVLGSNKLAKKISGSGLL
jgi:putative aldouronate transport system permease protein